MGFVAAASWERPAEAKQVVCSLYARPLARPLESHVRPTKRPDTAPAGSKSGSGARCGSGLGLPGLLTQGGPGGFEVGEELGAVRAKDRDPAGLGFGALVEENC